MRSAGRARIPIACALGVLALAAMGGTAPASAREAAATGRASASVVEPIRVQALADLDFGCLAVTGSGSVTVDPATSTGSYAGGVTAISPGGRCTAAAAEFLVTGEQDREYRFAIDPDVVARHVADPAYTLEVANLAGHSAGQPAAGAGARLGNDGRDRLRIGGTLEVPAQARPGRYIARVTVTVAYN